MGLVGYGLAGAVFHAPLIEATRGLSLAAIVTSDRVRKDDARRAHPAARIFESTEQLWDDAPSLELIVIASPNGGPPPVDPADAVAALEIIEAARRSAEGHTIEIL